MALAAWSLLMSVVNAHAEHAATADWNGFAETAAWSAHMLTACALGSLVVVRSRGNRAGWAFAAGGLSGLLAVAADHYAGFALVTHPGTWTGGVAARFVSFLAFCACWTVLGAILPLVFPTGATVSRRWRPFVWLAVAGGAAFGATIFKPDAFRDDGLLGNVPSVVNPLALPAPSVVQAIADAGVFALFGAMFAGVVSLVVRAVRSHGDERQQVKVVAYAAVMVTVTSLAVANWARYVGHVPGARGAISVVEVLIFLALPVSLALSVLKYRLYDIDRIINRTFVYAALTATLAAAYAGGVFLLGQATRPLTRGSDVAVAGSTLMVAGLFRPARARLQRFIDRRFNRVRYDAARTLQDFSVHMREQTDLESLVTELRGVVARTMQPSHVSLWLPGPQQQQKQQ
ncbi:MAG TPA: hypothetical protein VNE62_01590 [Actinomycetota bacterium]|nr:hypothetical protein [Actinomycetota bacterium]